ncbi:MAG: hypothetical protein CMN78_01760 [Spirochaetales bacterium]|nr:hypothetical protein [Spirochaetales bacterium]
MNLSFALVMLLIPLSAFPQATYVSNALGMKIREIEPGQAEEHEYVLRIIEGDLKTTKLLLKENREEKRWETRYIEGSIATETVYTAGLLAEERTYQEGKIVAELYYENEVLIERREYTYEDGVLRTVAAFDQNNMEIYQDIYERSATGRLRSIRREAQGEEDLSTFTYATGRLVGEWHATDDEGILFRYHGGEKVSVETWEGLKLVLSEEIKTHQGKKEVVVNDVSLGIKTTQFLDDRERIQIERTETDADLVEHIRFGYEQEMLVEKTRITRNAREEWDYEYDDEGKLIREVLTRNTRLVKIIVHIDDDTYYEEIYRNERPSLRVHFSDGIKISEEYLQQKENAP